MPIECPRCKHPLYLSVKTEHIFSVKDVGLKDVIPGEKVDEKVSSRLFCINCNFMGWVENYHEEANGIIRLFKPGEKHGTIKKNNREKN